MLWKNANYGVKVLNVFVNHNVSQCSKQQDNLKPQDTSKRGPLKSVLYRLDPRALHIKFEMVDVGIIINGKWQNDTSINNEDFYFILSKRMTLVTQDSFTISCWRKKLVGK